MKRKLKPNAKVRGTRDWSALQSEGNRVVEKLGKIHGQLPIRDQETATSLMRHHGRKGYLTERQVLLGKALLSRKRNIHQESQVDGMCFVFAYTDGKRINVLVTNNPKQCIEQAQETSRRQLTALHCLPFDNQIAAEALHKALTQNFKTHKREGTWFAATGLNLISEYLASHKRTLVSMGADYDSKLERQVIKEITGN